MDNLKRRFTKKTQGTRNSDDARAHTYHNPITTPQTPFFSDSPITSSPQISPNFFQGPPTSMYPPQQHAAWGSTRPDNYPSPPFPPGYSAQNEYYHPPTPQSPPIGFRSQNRFPPTTPHRSFTDPSPGFNLPPNRRHPPPPKQTSQFTEIDELEITNGQFSTLTDSRPEQGTYTIASRTKKVTISGGQFTIGNTHHVTELLNNTADVAGKLFNRDESRYGNLREQEEEEEEPGLC